MTPYKQKVFSAIAILIIATMFILGDSIFYIMFFRAMRENGNNFIAAFQAHHIRIPAFVFVTVVWLVLSILATVRFRKIARYYGRNIWSFLGTSLCLMEWVGFIFLIVFLFI